MPEPTQASAAPSQRRVIAVIDGNSLMHRAFHAMPPADDRRRTAAPPTRIFGFFNMFIKMVGSLPPGRRHLSPSTSGKPRVRMEMLPQYKAQRPPMDPAACTSSSPWCKELLARSATCPCCELEGWEGDDILGTLARRGEAAGLRDAPLSPATATRTSSPPSNVNDRLHNRKGVSRRR